MSLIQQQYGITPMLVSIRILYWTTLGMTFICYQMYSASLTSVFTAEKFNPPINDLDVR